MWWGFVDTRGRGNAVSMVVSGKLTSNNVGMGPEKAREHQELAHSTSVTRLHYDGAMTLH